MVSLLFQTSTEEAARTAREVLGVLLLIEHKIYITNHLLQVLVLSTFE